jgi:hypothetical protein
VLRWHRDIVRRRWARPSQHTRPGRPATRRSIRGLVLRLARENPGWGYRRIHGELAGLGIQIAASTVWEILTNAAVPPAPRRAGPTWAQFLHGHAQAILAADFFTVDLLDGATAYVLAVIEHATRQIRILGVTAHPDNAWVTQMARNLLMDLDGHLESVKFLLRDRDTKFTAAVDAVFTAAGIRILRSPIQAPRANAIMERWIGGCRPELLDRTLTWNQRHLRHVLQAYETHHNARGSSGGRGSSRWRRSCAGTGSWSPGTGPTRGRRPRSAVVRASRRSSGLWWCGWPGGTRRGGIAASTANSSASGTRWRLRPFGRSCTGQVWIWRRDGPGRGGESSAGPKPTRCWRVTLHRRHRAAALDLRLFRPRDRHPPDHILGLTRHPTGEWVSQQARNFAATTPSPPTSASGSP